MFNLFPTSVLSWIIKAVWSLLLHTVHILTKSEKEHKRRMREETIKWLLTSVTSFLFSQTIPLNMLVPLSISLKISLYQMGVISSMYVVNKEAAGSNVNKYRLLLCIQVLWGLIIKRKTDIADIEQWLMLRFCFDNLRSLLFHCTFYLFIYLQCNLIWHGGDKKK